MLSLRLEALFILSWETGAMLQHLSQSRRSEGRQVQGSEISHVSQWQQVGPAGPEIRDLVRSVGISGPFLLPRQLSPGSKRILGVGTAHCRPSLGDPVIVLDFGWVCFASSSEICRSCNRKPATI